MTGFLRLAMALACAVALSQFPAFSDQYVQRLGGQVDALGRIARDFDASAERAGVTRAEALADLSGSAFRELHQADMTRAFDRLDHAEADLAMLRLAGPLERMLLPHRLRDPETLSATWGDFSPAIPVTFAGLAAGGIGFLLGWLLFGLLALPFRRRDDRLGWR
ncbi:DUF2937 family protein [Paracoccus tegillarcae]|uniref:DUF2937 domain-containing protein n=1 Tax=Paracoccus tegillarcae TaxID=1529068 RepID=A0A2K9EHD1_9RHOB|nr:DUF2937 family protein [Paracoccus tegillarcae]AUH34370.1 DUF2937 domain-containing protein [Paracoccus tegillarcae]